MASKEHIAKQVDEAYALLRAHTPIIAEQLSISAPSFDGHGRYDLEYRRAEELHAIGLFLQDVATRLQDASIPSSTEEITDNGLLQAVTELVSSGNWTKAQVEALLLGDNNG
jgi:hypothetical protein